MVVFALTLVRHAETDYNVQSVIQGQRDVPLSETGQKQAQLLATRLQNQKYSHVYASDLIRAYETAETILAKNTYSELKITKEERLRERKFGDVEGKPIKYLLEQAKKCNQNFVTFTPSGGETLKQVHNRAISFFKSLCSDIIELEKSQEVTIHKSKRLKCNDNGFSNLPKPDDKSANPTVESSTNFCDNLATEQSVNGKTSNGDSESIPKDEVDGGIEDTKFNASSEVAKEYDLNSNLQSDLKSLKIPSESSSACNQEKNLGLSFSDTSIRSNIRKSYGGLASIQDECPNVSLSPLIEKQVSPFLDSSAVHACTSTRKISVDSCDEDDLPPAMTANVLVISHGGIIRELLKYFVEELDCTIPGGKAQISRNCPNTGISRFTVSMQPNDDHVRVTCLEIFDRDHLNIHKNFK